MTHTFGNPEEMQNAFPTLESSRPRPDLNGIRVKSPVSEMIYLVDQGKKRLIPDPHTYNNLFANWSNIVVSLDVDGIDTGTPISEDAILVKCTLGSDNVYLIDNKCKRWVTTPEAMQRYNFGHPTHFVPQIVIDSIPSSSDITA